jgi:hypothetical protein
MCLRYSALIQKQVSENILFFAVGIINLVLMFQIYARILPLTIIILTRYISTNN